MMPLEVGQKVSWENSKGIHTGRIVRLFHGNDANVTKQYQNLRRQLLAEVKLENGETCVVDRGFLTTKKR